MPKMINPAIGWCACPVCGTRGSVKRFKSAALTPSRARRGGRLYVECREHGTFTSAAPGFQDWILDRAELWGPEGEPVAVPDAPKPKAAPPVAAPAAAAPAAPAPKTEKAASWGFFS